MNFISKIQYIVENTSEIGMYEHDIFKIKINKPNIYKKTLKLWDAAFTK